LGAANLTVTGNGYTLDVSAMDATNFDVLGISVGAGASLTLSAAEADNKLVEGVGTVKVVNLNSAIAADLSSLQAGTVLIEQTLSDTTVAFQGDVGNAHVSTTGLGILDLTGIHSIGADASFTVGAETTLSIKAGDVSTKTVDGAGHLTVMDLTSVTNLSGVSIVGGRSDQYVRPSNSYQTDDGYGLKAQYVQKVDLSAYAGQTVDLYAIGLNGLSDTNIALWHSGGQFVAADEDMGGTVEGSGASGGLYGCTIQAGDYVELSFYWMETVPNNQSIRLEVMSVGDVPGVGPSVFRGDYVLTAAQGVVEAVVSNVDGVGITENQNLGAVTFYTVQENSALTLTATQANNRTVNAAGDVVVVLNDTAFNLTGVTTTGVGTFTATSDGALTLNALADLGAVGSVTVSTGSLTLTAAQADALSILGDGTTVTVTHLENALGANLSGLAETLVTIAELDSTGGLVLGAAANLTHVDTITITGAGTVSAHPEAVLGAGDYSVGAQATLSLTATQANGLHADGDGAVVVNHLEDALAGNYSNLTAGTVTLKLEANPLSGDSNLFAGQLSNTAQFEIGNHSLTLTSADANNRTVSGSNGTLVVDGIQTTTNLTQVTTGVRVVDTGGFVDTFSSSNWYEFPDGYNSGVSYNYTGTDSLTLAFTDAQSWYTRAAINIDPIGKSGTLTFDLALAGTGDVVVSLYDPVTDTSIDTTYNSSATSITVDVQAGQSLYIGLNTTAMNGAASASISNVHFAHNEPGLAAVVAHITGDSNLDQNVFDITSAYDQDKVTSYVIDGTYAFKLRPDQANLTYITGNVGAQTTVEGTAYSDADLTRISTVLSLGTGVDTNGHELAANITQLDGQTVTGNGSVYIYPSGSWTDLDLSKITAASVGFDAPVLVANGNILKISSEVANGNTFTGVDNSDVGTIELYGLNEFVGRAFTNPLDLSNVFASAGSLKALITVATDLSSQTASNLTTIDQYVVSNDTLLTLNAAEASGATVIDAAGSDVHGKLTVVGFDGTTDLANVTVTGTVTATITGNVNIDTGNSVAGNSHVHGVVDAYVIDGAHMLNIYAVDADATTITGASGTVHIIAIENNAAGDFYGVTAGAVELDVSNDVVGAVNFTGAVSADAHFNVGTNSTLVLSEATASGRTVDGTGSLEISGIKTTTVLSNLVLPEQGGTNVTDFTGAFAVWDTTGTVVDSSYAFSDTDANGTNDTLHLISAYSDAYNGGSGGFGKAYVASATVLEAGQVSVHFSFSSNLLNDGSNTVGVHFRGGDYELPLWLNCDVTNNLVGANAHWEMGGYVFDVKNWAISAGTVTGTLVLDARVGQSLQFYADSMWMDSEITLTDFTFTPTVQTTPGLASIMGHVTADSVDAADVFDIVGTSNLDKLTGYSIDGGYTLKMSSAQADGLVVVQGAETIGAVALIDGNVAGGISINLLGIGSDVSVSFGSGEDAGIVVGLGSTLTLRADQVNAQDITGTDATVAIAGDVTGIVDLRGVTATTVTFQTGSEITDTLDVSGEGHLLLNAAVAHLKSITGNGQVNVYGLQDKTTADLSGLVGGLTVTAMITANTDLTGNLVENLAHVDSYVVSDGVLLTLNANAANGATVVDAEGAAGKLDVVGLVGGSTGNGGTDLSNVTVSGTLTVDVTGETDISANTTLLGVDEFNVADGAVLTLTAQQANGNSVTANGTNHTGAVVITGIENKPDADLTGIHSPDITLAVSANLDPLTFAGDLGDAKVSIGEYTYLTLSADQANGRTVLGTGSLVVDALQSTTDLSNVEMAGAPVSPVSNFVNGFDATHWSTNLFGDWTFDIAPDATTLTLHAGWMGQVILTAPQSGGKIGFTWSNADAVATSLVIQDPWGIVPDNTIVLSGAGGSMADVEVPAGYYVYLRLPMATSTLTLSNFSFTPAGGAPGIVSLTGHITATSDLTEGVFDITGSSGLDKVTAYSIDGTYTLKLGSAMASGLTVYQGDQTAGGTVFVSDDVANNATVNLTNINANVSLSFGADLEAGIAVGTDGLLTLRADQATGQTITGAGAVRIAGDLLDIVDLSKATAHSVQFDLNSDGVVDAAITVTASQTLKVGGDQLVGTAVTVEGHLDVYLGTGDEAFDLDALVEATGTGLVTVHVISDLNLSGNSHFSEITHFVVDPTVTLTLDPSLANNTYVSGEGAVHVTDLGVDANALTVNLANLTATSVTATFATSGEFTGNLGTALVTVSAGRTMTVSADIASAHTITGSVAEGVDSGGSIVITGLGEAPVDLSLVTAGAGVSGDTPIPAGTFTTTISTGTVYLDPATKLGTLALTIDGAETTVGFSVDQADGRVIGGSGTAEIHGDITGDNTLVDLTQVGAAISFNDAGEPSPTIAVDAQHTLVLNASQASGQLITGGGTVQIADNVTADTVNLKTISATLNFTANGLDVANGATLQLTADQASGQTISGAGTLSIEGLTETTDLSKIGKSISSGLTGVLNTDSWTKFYRSTGTVATSADALTIAANSDQYVNYYVDPGLEGDFTFHYSLSKAGSASAFMYVGGTYHAISSTDGGAGTMTVHVGATDRVQVYLQANGGSGTFVLDQISYAAPNGPLDVNVAVVDSVDVSANAHLASVDAYNIANGKTLTLNASEIAGRTISGAGTVVLKGDVAAGIVDLTHIDAATTFLIDGGDIAVAWGATLKIPHGLLGSTVVSGDGTLEVVGDLTTGATLDLQADTLNNVSFGNDGIDITGATLKMTATQIQGQYIFGVGTLVVSGNVPADGWYMDLSSVSTDTMIDFTDSLDGAFGITVGTDSVLEINAAHLSGKFVSGPGTIQIYGTLSNAVDLSHVASDVSIDLTQLDNINSWPTLPALSSGHELVLTTSQAAGLTIAQPDAIVRITDVGNALDQYGNLSVNLSGITAQTVTLDVDVPRWYTPVTVMGQLGSTQVTVEGYASLIISAELASGVTIGGSGDVLITGDVATGTTVDLSKVTATGLTFDGNDIVVDGATLIVGAAQALSSGANFSGTGTVSIVGAHLDEVSALSSVTATTKNIAFVEAGSLLNSSVSFDGVHEITLATGTTDLSATQADGRVFSGAGGVSIHDGAGVQSYNGTAHDDTIFGFGGDSNTVIVNSKPVVVPDTVDLSQGGHDTVVFSGLANDMSVTGLTFATGADSDVLNFANLSGQLYNHNNSVNGHVASLSGSAYNLVTVNGDGALFTENTDHTLTEAVLAPATRFTGFVAVMLDVTAENERGVASVFAISNTLNKLVDTGGDMVFLMADAAGDTNVWHWTDSGVGLNHDGNVQYTELTKLATLVGVDQTDLANIRENNIHFVV